MQDECVRALSRSSGSGVYAWGEISHAASSVLFRIGRMLLRAYVFDPETNINVVWDLIRCIERGLVSGCAFVLAVQARALVHQGTSAAREILPNDL